MTHDYSNPSRYFGGCLRGDPLLCGDMGCYRGDQGMCRDWWGTTPQISAPGRPLVTGSAGVSTMPIDDEPEDA